MNDPIHVYDEPSARDLPESPEALLDWLKGPTLFRRQGRDRSRVRTVIGLLHGNEPSGLVALHRALLHPEPFAVDTLLFLGAVEAARAEPRHGHRMLPGRRDLNRSFGLPPSDTDTRIAAAARRLLGERLPEAVIDVHNNTGENPAYGVGLRESETLLGLTRLFARRFIHTEYRMGTLIETFDASCPALTIEAGRAGDPAADALAARGVLDFLTLPRLEALPREPAVQVLRRAIRVELAPGLELAYAHEPTAADLVLDVDLDRHNFCELAPGSRIGFVRAAVWPLRAVAADGRERSRELFEVEAGELFTRVPMVPVMITTQPAMARADCLFYALSPS